MDWNTGFSYAMVKVLQKKQRKVDCFYRESTKLGHSGEKLHSITQLSMGFAQQYKTIAHRYLLQP